MRSQPRTVLDVACGTGQLASVFLEHGFDVIGIDLSPHMIEIAVENNRVAVEAGRAAFRVADASSFTIPDSVSFAVSTFDALNHLPSIDALKGCFQSVYAALGSRGLFVFDLNTARGLARWNGINVQDSDELTVINRGIYAPGADRAYTSITGFVRRDDGAYDRFKEVAYNTVFKMADVNRVLTETGFRETYVADSTDLGARIEDPEAMGRAFFVCTKE